MLAAAVNDHVFWITSRAAGTLALLFSSVAVVVGLSMGGKLIKGRGPDLRVAHEALSMATIVAIVVHAVPLPRHAAAGRSPGGRAMSAGIVIAGGGLAGQRCAETLRRAGYEGRIRMLCGEPRAPYDRPPLSKAVLADAEADHGLRLRPPSWYAD